MNKKNPVLFVLARLFLSLLSLSIFTSVHAQSVLKVMILDVGNTGKNPDYQYLEVSITDAVRDLLKKKFFFHDLSRETILDLAGKNYYFPEDFHTATAGMQMGLSFKQDIVLNGGFSIVKSKDKKKADSISTDIRIIDIEKKIVVKQIHAEGYADNRIFESIDELAKKVAEEAKSIFPSKEDMAKRGFILDEQDLKPRLNQISLAGSYQAISFPSPYSGKLNGTRAVSLSDFTGAYAGNLDYRRYNFPFDQTFFWAKADFFQSIRNFNAALSQKEIAGQLDAVSALAGLAYRRPVFEKLFLNFSLGGGYSLAEAVLDYKNLEAPPLNLKTGKAEKSQLIMLNSPEAFAGISLEYYLVSRISLEIGIQYKQFFYENKSPAMAFSYAGIGLRL